MQAVAVIEHLDLRDESAPALGLSELSPFARIKRWCDDVYVPESNGTYLSTKN